MPSDAFELVRRTIERFQEGDRSYWRSVFAYRQFASRAKAMEAAGLT